MADATQLEPGAGVSPAETPDPAHFSHTPDVCNASAAHPPAKTTAAVVQGNQGLLKAAKQHGAGHP